MNVRTHVLRSFGPVVGGVAPVSATETRADGLPNTNRTRALRSIRHPIALLALVVMAVCANVQTTVAAESPRQVTWEELVPPLEKFDDPFLDLTMEQTVDLRTIARLREAEQSGVEIEDASRRRAEAAAERLGRDKIDVDGLLARRAEIKAKRQQAAEAANESLNGLEIRLAGYVLPLEAEDRKVTEFLLVPYVGACIHAPMPTANQIVHVKSRAGFEVSGLFVPVWVQGRVRVVRSEPLLHLIDGANKIPTAYEIEAGEVTLYRE